MHNETGTEAGIKVAQPLNVGLGSLSMFDFVAGGCGVCCKAEEALVFTRVKKLLFAMFLMSETVGLNCILWRVSRAK